MCIGEPNLAGDQRRVCGVEQGESTEAGCRDEVAKIDADNRRMDFLESKVDKVSRQIKSNVVHIARKEIQRDKEKGSRKISPVVSSWSARDRFEKKLIEERMRLKNA